MFGKVDRVEQRTVNTKWGPKPVFDLIVDGTKYSWGFKNPTSMGITDGAEIEFDVVADKYGPKINAEHVVLKTSGSGAGPTVATSGTSGGARGRADMGFPVPVTSDKISILRQNALTNARELVQAYPAIFTKDQTEKEMLAAILKIASKFSDFTSGRDIEEKVAKLTSKMAE